MVRDNDLVGHFHRLILVVGYKYACDSKLCHHLFEPGTKFCTHLCVNRCKRLIQKQYLRIRCKRPGKSHTLSLSTGKLVRIPFLHSGKSGQLQKLRDAFFNFFLRHLHQFKTKCHIIIYRHVTEQCVILKYKANASFGCRNIVDTLSVDVNITGIRCLKSCDHTKQRCLATSGRSEQCHQFSFFNPKAHMVGSPEIAVIFANIFHFYVHFFFLPL